MQYAIVNNERSLPTPHAKGLCPGCGDDVIAKCGSINVWHWAHKNADCDPWYEPESEWHRTLKDKVPPEYQEVCIGNHRADIWGKDWGGPVIELQNSPISSEEIQEREQFYNKYIETFPHKMVWLINGAKFEDRFDLRDKGGYYTFRWLHPRRSWSSAKNSIVIIHFPQRNLFFEVKKSYNQMSSGWGVSHDVDYHLFKRWFYCASI